MPGRTTQLNIKEDKIMALRIVNNIAAMNTQRWLGISDAGMKKSLERLSSGYRINKAADDAAGLAISQSFRADIASFKVASRNTSEANALLQVAEGGMDQIGNMLTRLKELATQASSANVGSAERAKIDAEGDALLNEIDRIANSSKYGTTALLDGTFGASKDAASFVSTGVAGTNKVYGDLTHVYCAISAEASGIADLSFNVTGLSTMCATTWTFSAAVNGLTLGNGTTTEVYTPIADSWAGGASISAGATLTFANLGLTVTVDSSVLSAGTGHSAAFCGATFKLYDTGVTSLNVEGANTGVYTFVAGLAAGSIQIGNGTSTQTIENISPGTAQNLNFDLLGVTFSIGTTYTEDDLEGVSFTVSSTGSTGSTFQIGAENDSNNRISISIGGAAKSNLGITSLDLSTAANAQAALDLVDTAISTLTSTRGNVGAYMNRLSYAAANLATTIENQQAAESVIRDVDMAAEMTDFTKNQILLQAGTSMLAQANMAPQQVLALFG
jgi:flagellin